MNDSAVRVTIAGLIAALVMDSVMYVINLLGISTVTPWTVAADVFLTQSQVNTPTGVIIGLIGTVALNIAAAIIVLLVLKYTGSDYAVLKGILSVNAFSFASMGLFMPLLKISPQIQNQPLSNLIALGVLTVAGVVIATALKRMGTGLKD